MREQSMRYTRYQTSKAENHVFLFCKNTLLLFMFMVSLNTTNFSKGFAADSDVTALSVIEPWARPTIGSNSSTSVYLTIKNSGKQDTLQTVSSSITDSAELHTIKTHDGMLMMEEVKQGFIIENNEMLVFKPKGTHIMLKELASPLQIGDSFILTLHFKNAGLLLATIPVRNRKSRDLGKSHH